MSETPAMDVTRLLRVLLGFFALLLLLSAGVHVLLKETIGAEFASSEQGGRVFELLSAQAWLYAALIGGLLCLIGYFLLLPMARRVERSDVAVAEAEREVEHTRRHDVVTGLPGRRYLYELLQHGIAMGRRHGHTVGLLRLELRGFRRASSRLGQEAADRLTLEVASSLRHSVRAADYAARIGTDEYAILVPEVRTVEGLGRIADRLMEEIAEIAARPSIDVSIRCAMGIAVAWPDEQASADELMHRADQALTEAEAEEENAWRYHASAEQGLTNRLSVASG